jgi:biotin synthase
MTAKLPAGIEPISGDEARRLIHHTEGAPLEALIARSAAVRQAIHGQEVALCGIVNAKSGHCPEDCGFCSQSAHFKEAQAPEYPLMSARQIADQARTAEKAGAREFSIVTSGTRVAREQELATIEEAVRLIRAESSVEPCASLGLMRKPALERLKGAGLMHYHHNLETARSFFDQVCSTHTYDEQLDTIREARDLGYKVCSGGILGMGETPEQRVEFAETIRDLGIDCVPMNFLNPRPGTPMAEVKAITPGECLAAVAIFRLMMPTAHIFVMGGREVNLGALQHRIFEAGADGTMVGNYLTSAGGTPDQVNGMVRDQGLTLRPPSTGKAWGFTGEVDREIHWNEQATSPRSLPVVR